MKTALTRDSSTYTAVARAALVVDGAQGVRRRTAALGRLAASRRGKAGVSPSQVPLTTSRSYARGSSRVE